MCKYILDKINAFCNLMNDTTTCKKIIYTLHFLISVCLFASLISCGAKSKEDIPSPFLNLPEYKLSEEEKDHLNRKCSEWFDTMLRRSNFNGGMLVSKNGIPVFETYRGLSHVKNGDSISNLTPFHIASVSKTFTAMSILLLENQGKLNIDSSFTHYFPEAYLPGVSLRMLLNHRSGLPNYAYFMEDLGWNKKDTLKNEDILHALTTRRKEIKNIGRSDKYFSYSNTNYALLALVIEKVSGKSYSAFLQENFFTPLQMNNTFVYRMNDSLHDGLSYDGRGTAIPVNFLDDIYGDKNIYSTPRDLLQWSRGLEPGIIFDSATLAKAFTPYSNEKPGKKNYGLGWRMNIFSDGSKTIFHNGWWHGNNAVFIHLYEQNACIIVLGNYFTRNIYKAHQLIGLFIHSLADEVHLFEE